jgi:WD40 repeat protein
MLITSQSSYEGCQITLQDLKTGKEITRLSSRIRILGGFVRSASCKQTLAINPRDSSQVAYAHDLSIRNIGSDDKSNLSLRLEDKEDVSFSGSIARDGSIAFSPDGKNIAVSTSKSVFIWQPEVNKFPQYKFDEDKFGEDSVEDARSFHDQGISTLSFSPDNQYLAFGDDADGVIRLWDFKNSKQPNRTIAQKYVGQPFKLIEFSPNGKTLVSVGNDRAIKIWEVN